jgi:hypothetical protein
LSSRQRDPSTLEFAVALGALPAVRAEGVAEVVEAEGAEPYALLGVLVAAAEGGSVDPPSSVVREDQVVGAAEAFALDEAGEGLRDLRDHRDGAAVAADAEKPELT